MRRYRGMRLSLCLALVLFSVAGCGTSEQASVMEDQTADAEPPGLPFPLTPPKANK